MAKTVFHPNEIKSSEEKIMLKLPHDFEPEVEEVEELPEPEYTGPTVEDLKREAEEFKIQWEAEKQQMLEKAQADADAIVAKAEQAAFEQVKRQTDQAQVIKSDAEQEAAEILKAAQDKAQSLIADAEQQQQKIRDDAYQSGFEEGKDLGFKDGSQEVERLVDRLHVILDRIMDKRQEILEPVLAAPLQKADDARHAEQRQPRAEGGPFRLAVRGEVRPRRDVGREEEALENVEVPLVPAVEQSAPPARRVVDARVLHDGQDRRDEQHARHQHADDGLAEKQQEIPEVQAVRLRQQAQEEVDQRKRDLPDEEIIVHEAAQKDGERENPAPPRRHVLVERPEHEREEDDRLVEVVEEDVVDGKAGERVQQPAEDGGVPARDVPAQVVRARQAGAGELEDEQRPHQVRHGLAREGNGQPEKRAAEQVERVAADEVRAEVGRPAPAEIAAAHGVVAHLVERHLLDVEVPVKEEIAVVKKDERDEKEEGDGKRNPERAEQAAPAPAGEHMAAQLLEPDSFDRHGKPPEGAEKAAA